jgi:two-component system, NarL family, sensor kinase
MVRKSPPHATEATTNGPFDTPSELHSSSNWDVTEAQILRAVLDGLDVGVATVSPEGVILYANPRFAEMLMVPIVADPAGIRLRSLVSPASWPALDTALVQGGREPSSGEVRVQAVNGESRTIRLSFGSLPRLQTQALRIVATEVTQLVNTTRALRDSEASLQLMTMRLFQLQDEERRRMARDLHDITGQELAVALMALDQLTKNEDALGADSRMAIAELSDSLRKVETETRTLSYVLHPPLLDELGLAAALGWYVEGFTKRTGLEVDTDMPKSIPRLSSETETALFRVVQESLTNVLRHSGSSRASVRISMQVDCMQVSVKDEGKGFDFRKTSSNGSRSGVGLAGMHGRLSVVGGKLEVESGEGGTLVTATVPVRKGESTDGSLEVRPAIEAPQHGRVATTSSAPTCKKRILVADDHEIARRGIRDLFREERDLEICGEAKDGAEAVVEAEELDPDLIILDLSMPNMGGISAATHIRRAGNQTKILIYTTHAYPQIERIVRAAGCEGYVQKANAGRDLVRAVRAVLQGKTFFESENAMSRSA